jgi:pimeloyl-ACP methyl ester carboxylesterase
MAMFLGALERFAHRALKGQGFASRTVAAGAEKLHAYDARGSGDGPPVVFLHGIGGSATAYAPVAARLLRDSKRVVMLEFPGHGSSPEPAVRPLTPKALYRAVTHAIDALLDEPHVVVGNSLGGASAIAHTIARPRQVRGLFLLSPAGALLPKEDGEDVLSTFRMNDRAAGNRFLDKVYHRTPFYARAFAHEMPAWICREPVRELLDHAHEIPFSPEELGSISSPTVLYWGRSERLLPRSSFAFLKEHLPAHTRVEEPHGMGHCPQLDDPKALAVRLRAFLREIG